MDSRFDAAMPRGSDLRRRITETGGSSASMVVLHFIASLLTVAIFVMPVMYPCDRFSDC